MGEAMPIPRIYEVILWVVGGICLSFCLIINLQSRSYRALAAGIDDRHPSKVPRSSDPVIGTIEVSALGLSAPITPDIDAGSLQLGVGHIRGTAVPGGLGTVGIAGHRDSFFRPLRRILPGMDIKLSGENGAYHYIVDSTEIVSPDKVDVLDIGHQPALTLITCFPFDYIGAAPRRFIVHAHLLSLSPDTVSPTR
jgi:sortase A